MKKAALILILSASFALAKDKNPVKSTCTPGPREQCPSDLQLREWNEMKALEKKYTPPTPTEDDRIRYQGLQSDWNNNIPKGYTWDAAKVRWVQVDPPAPAPTPAPKPAEPEKK